MLALTSTKNITEKNITEKNTKKIDVMQMGPTFFANINTGKIAYSDSDPQDAQKPVVLCIPGLGDIRQEYRYLYRDLVAQNYRVVVMDLRGHGESSTHWPEYTASSVGLDALALLDFLQIKRAFFVGTSLGAGAATYAAAQKPDAVAGLILIGAFVRDHPTSIWMRALMWLLFQGPWHVAAWMMYVDSLYPSKKPDDHQAWRRLLAASLQEKSRFDALLALMYASKSDVAACLHDVTAPALVVMGTKDADFKNPLDEAQWIAQHLGSSHKSAQPHSVLPVEGAGHYPHAEYPELVTPAVLAFLQKNAKTQI